MTYTPGLNGGRVNVTLGGNTAGAAALVSTGTMQLAGGNNVTLSQNANSITLSGANVHNVTLAGNSTSAGAGYAQISTGTLTIAGGNNITLSQNANAVTISAFNQSVQTQNLHNVTLAGNSTSAGAGYAQISSGTMTLAGGNNITLSQNGNAVTISAGAGGGGVALYDGAASISSGTAVFSDANNVSFGINGQTITASAGAGGGGVALYDGANSISSGTAVFSDANNVSFGFNGQTITASAAAGGNNLTALVTQNRQLGASSITVPGQNSVWLVPFLVNTPVSASSIMQMVSLTGSTASNSSGTVSATYRMALYKNTAATNISRMDSIWSSAYSMTFFVRSNNSMSASIDGGASGQQTNIANASVATNSTKIWGLRQITFNLNTILDPDLYAFGYVLSTASAGGSAPLRSFSPVIDNPLPSAMASGFGGNTANSIGYADGGVWSATSAAMPASFNLTDINQTLDAMPYVRIGAI